MVDIFGIYEKYYKRDSGLWDILETHSTLVASKAIECGRARNIDFDADFVWEAALLHDIGIVMCDAPGILCTGSEPYICHGLIGRKMLEEEGLRRHALVCERHTGAGLAIDDIVNQNLPLPHRDMLPVTTEEKLICYADKFFSKSGDYTKEKSLDKVVRSMERHGPETMKRFLLLHEMFG